ncbi:MAG: hypothetical protein Q8L84_08475 [Hyphomonas sp.]|nr:hypothetical protein [Hyphomonas sp.]
MRTLQRKAARWVRVAGSDDTGDAVAFLMTPASALQYDMALERAMTAARQLHESGEIRAAYGLDALPPEAMGEEDSAASLGVSTTVLATEVALIVATEMRGYLGEDGETPAAWTRRNVALAMQDWQGGRSIAQRFLDVALAPVYEARTEGKLSAAGPNTTGAAAAGCATDAAS